MNDELLKLTAEIVEAYVGNNRVQQSELPDLIASVSNAMTRLAVPAEVPVEKQAPAVNPKRSVFPDYIVSLENGQQLKSLKRHLMTHYGLTPDQYRQKWNLPPDYPMVAPNYAATRSRLAKNMGLGRKANTRRGGRARKA